MLGKLLPPKREKFVVDRQIDDCLRLAKAAALGGIFNATVAAATMWSTGYQLEIVIWWLLICSLAIGRVLHRQSLIDIDEQHRSEARVSSFIELIALTNGVLWGAGLALASMVASAIQFNLLAMLCGGMMGAAVMTYGPMWRAALAYILPLSLGCVAAWSISTYAPTASGILLIVSYVGVLTRGVITTERFFAEKVIGEHTLKDSAETVQLLLNDYEAQSSDWLWEVDEDGLIINPVTRFADACGRVKDQIDGAFFINLFEPSADHSMLVDCIENNTPFRDLTLQLIVGGTPHWWTLSARTKRHGGMRGVAADVTAEKRAEARVSYMAHYDGLTDLANRFLFNESLQRALNRLKAKESVTVLCLDLDQFKSVNDTLGHPIGDKLLCEAARRIEACVRETDLVARLGGDEFAVLMRGNQKAPAVEACALRIIEAIAQPFILDEMQVMTSASIGAASAGRGELNSADLMKMADLALYSAKANGRNRLAHFEPGMDEAARERRDLEMDLRAALARGEFELHYQPLVNIGTGETVSYEALVRWNHPERGVVMPGMFIPVAEETGLIVQLGEWVIRQAASELAKWQDHLRVSVNLSPAQMRSSSLISTVINAIASAGVDPQRFELEITESVLMQDSEVNVATLHKLRDFGVKISLDDFGTGYSSLNYLRSFPFDKIKIDRCFVEDIDSREDCRAIVRAVTGLASSLGMVTTAEGVEHKDQLDRLRTEGCTEVQGYLFSRPGRAEEYTNLRIKREGSEVPAQGLIDEAIALLPALDLPTPSHKSRGKKSA